MKALKCVLYSTALNNISYMLGCACPQEDSAPESRCTKLPALESPRTARLWPPGGGSVPRDACPQGHCFWNSSTESSPQSPCPQERSLPNSSPQISLPSRAPNFMPSTTSHQINPQFQSNHTNPRSPHLTNAFTEAHRL
jgi:hypothetical protein